MSANDKDLVYIWYDFGLKVIISVNLLIRFKIFMFLDTRKEMEHYSKAVIQLTFHYSPSTETLK